ncbi:MAG: universal stress protein [Gammaproteobacteria bacterium]|nr:universal stress protein [Gammaproteobacteria bacterium]
MANYQHILVALDFSDEGSNVMERALETAAQNQAKVSLINVVEYTSAMYAGDIPVPEELNLDQQLLDQARARMGEIADRFGITGGQQLVEIGVPKKEIVGAAEKLGADLIVIGSHGRHGLQLLLGSTANGVLHQARCDVLAVRVGKV